MVIFKDDKHENAFYSFLIGDMSSGDEYHKAAAYLLALNADIRAHAAEVFDFCADAIKPDALRAAWQTGESRKCTRLLYNLWNGLHDDDGDGSGAELYAVDSIFCGADAVYYWEAVKLRFGID